MKTLETSQVFFNFNNNGGLTSKVLDEITENLKDSGILKVINEASTCLSEVSNTSCPELITSCILLGYALKTHLDSEDLKAKFNLQ